MPSQLQQVAATRMLDNQSAVLSVQQMGQAEILTVGQSGNSYILMQSAAMSVANQIKGSMTSNTRFLFLCGQGNNGGDGFLAASLLAESGHTVEVLFCGSRGNIKQLSGDALLAWQEWDVAQHQEGDTIYLAEHSSESVKTLLEKCASKTSALMIVDAIFGSGLSRSITGPIAQLICAVNDLRHLHSVVNTLSIDLPSGVNGNSGKIHGNAIDADSTLSFCRKKPGHLLLPGSQHCGELVIADIGINSEVISKIHPVIFENTTDLWINSFPYPVSASHKYTRGHTLVASGPKHSTGAARLTAQAALRTGSGAVTLIGSSSAMDVHAAHCTEVMLRSIDDTQALEQLLTDDRVNAFVIGPGFGVGSTCREMAITAISHCQNVVLDADALTSFSKANQADPQDLFSAIKASTCNVILTPHAGEFQSLFSTTADIESCKLQLTLEAAECSGAIVVYKGADTIIAAPNGMSIISTHGLPWLATAGSGDVLAGTIAAMLAQSVFDKTDQPVTTTVSTIKDRCNVSQTEADLLKRVAASVWLHSEASRLIGPGLIASDIPASYPKILKSVISQM